MSLFVRDIVERVLSTFAVAFLAVLIASGWFSVDGITDVSILAKAALAGVAALLSLAKGVAARWIGDAGSASLSPKVGTVLHRSFD